MTQRRRLFGLVPLAAGMLLPYVALAGTWTNVSPSSSPPPRSGHGLAYDSQNQVVVMFGGVGSSNPPLSDTWIYDVANNTWTNAAPASPPPARETAEMVYASQAGLVVLFGGRSGNTRYDDTWVYHVGNNTWTNAAPASPPPPRNAFGMAYDWQQASMVVYAGQGNGSGFWNDTWSYDAQANQWTNEAPPQLPGAADHVYLVYDGDNGVVLQPGGHRGSNQTGTYSNDLWQYDVAQNGWTLRIAATTSPTVPVSRDHHHGAFLGSGLTLLFGGRPENMGQPFGDTWIYDYAMNAWTQDMPAASPPARVDHKIVTIGGGRALLFAGATNIPGSPLDDTWIYDGGGGPTGAGGGPSSGAGGSGGGPPSGAGGAATSGAGGSGPGSTGSGAAVDGGSQDDGGCGCRAAGAGPRSAGASLMLFALAGALATERRRAWRAARAAALRH